MIEKKLIHAKGLQVDATVYEREITYPTDCGLLEKARTFCVKQIGRLSPVVNKKVRTYCRVARKAYLNFTKTKRRTAKQIRRMQKSLLQYLRRNIDQVKGLVDVAKTLGQSIAERIVSLHKPGCARQEGQRSRIRRQGPTELCRGRSLSGSPEFRELQREYEARNECGGLSAAF